MKNKKYLYLIRCGNSNFYKIGTSENPEERLQILQAGCPYPLTLIYKERFNKPAKIVEKFLHKKYQSKRKIGEWFEFSKTEIEQIQQEQIMNSLLPKHIYLPPNPIPMLNKIRAKDNLPLIKL